MRGVLAAIIIFFMGLLVFVWIGSNRAHPVMLPAPDPHTPLAATVASHPHP